MNNNKVCLQVAGYYTYLYSEPRGERKLILLKQMLTFKSYFDSDSAEESNCRPQRFYGAGTGHCILTALL